MPGFSGEPSPLRPRCCLPHAWAEKHGSASLALSAGLSDGVVAGQEEKMEGNGFPGQEGEELILSVLEHIRSPLLKCGQSGSQPGSQENTQQSRDRQNPALTPTGVLRMYRVSAFLTPQSGAIAHPAAGFSSYG